MRISGQIDDRIEARAVQQRGEVSTDVLAQPAHGDDFQLPRLRGVVHHIARRDLAQCLQSNAALGGGILG